MNVYAWVLLVALAVLALVDWRAVARGKRDIEGLAKPAFLVLLIVLAWLLRADTVDYGRFLLLGLAASLVGDVLLLESTTRRFLGGLGAFLVAHLCYIAAFRRLPTDGPAEVPMLLVAAAVLAVIGLRVWPIVRREAREGWPVLVYAVVVGAMAVLAWATGHVVVGLGATLFAVSDALIGVARYERELPHGRLAVMVTYHVGQLLIVLGMMRC